MFSVSLRRHLTNGAWVLVMLLLTASTYADQVVVTNAKNNKGEQFVVGELEEGGKFYHDRDYTITEVPKELLGLTHIMTSADSLGGIDYLWTFEIDRPATLYIAFDSRFDRPEDREQEPKNWLNKAFTDTKRTCFLDDPHPKTEYWIYKSNEPYPKGEVTLFGLEAVRPVDPISMWTLFVEEGQLAVKPASKLATAWGALKAKRE